MCCIIRRTALVVKACIHRRNKYSQKYTSHTQRHRHIPCQRETIERVTDNNIYRTSPITIQMRPALHQKAVSVKSHETCENASDGSAHFHRTLHRLHRVEVALTHLLYAREGLPARLPRALPLHHCPVALSFSPC